MSGANAGLGASVGPPSDRSGVARSEPRRGIVAKPPARPAWCAIGTASGARTTSADAALCASLRLLVAA